MSSSSETLANTVLTENVTLQVQIPADVQVGGTINVLFEDNYYQIVVPENGPGNSIQVLLQNVPIRKTETAPIETNPENVNNIESADTDEPKMSPGMTAAIVGGAVVGAVVLAPIVAGVAVLGGAAYVVAKKQHPEGEPLPPDSVLAKATVLGHQAISTAQSLDQKYEITATATRVIGTSVSNSLAKAKEYDDKHQISATIVATTTTVIDKVKETDEKYQITEKATQAAITTYEAMKKYDEEHNISGQAVQGAVELTSTVFNYLGNYFSKGSAAPSSVPVPPVAEVIDESTI